MPIELAMKAVANNLKERKPKASAVKVDALPVLDPNAAPMMPNAMGGGAKTVIFADPNAPAAPAPAAPVPATPDPAPATPAAPAPAAPAATPAAPANPAPAPAPGSASAAAPAPTIASIPAPARPPLLNWPESKK
jgi:translation initiation factor IF-2